MSGYDFEELPELTFREYNLKEGWYDGYLTLTALRKEFNLSTPTKELRQKLKDAKVRSHVEVNTLYDTEFLVYNFEDLKKLFKVSGKIKAFEPFKKVA